MKKRFILTLIVSALAFGGVTAYAAAVNNSQTAQANTVSSSASCIQNNTCINNDVCKNNKVCPKANTPAANNVRPGNNVCPNSGNGQGIGKHHGNRKCK